MMPHTDTERLDFLLRWFSVEDVGDEEFAPGVVIHQEQLEDRLTGVLTEVTDDLRTVLDKALDDEIVER